MSTQLAGWTLKWIVCLVSLFAFSGCASFEGVTMTKLNIALLELQTSVEKALPVGKRDVSPNGREFFSKYFIPKKRRLKSASKKAKVRFYAHVFVLGDERPYTIRVVVKRQQRTKNKVGLDYEYSDEGTNKRLAQVVLKRIQRRLAKRREDLNIIDDFRVF